MKDVFFSAAFAWRQQGGNSLHRWESREGQCMMNKSQTAREDRERRQKEREREQKEKY